MSSVDTKTLESFSRNLSPYPYPKFVPRMQGGVVYSSEKLRDQVRNKAVPLLTYTSTDHVVLHENILPGVYHGKQR